VHNLHRPSYFQLTSAIKEKKLLRAFCNTCKRLVFRNITHAWDAYGIDYYVLNCIHDIKDFSSFLFKCLRVIVRPHNFYQVGKGILI
jgi:hypothetical protein